MHDHATPPSSLDKPLGRRTWLAGAAALVCGTPFLGGCATAIATSAAAGQQKTYVLVHGAWHGNWAWDAVKPRLEQTGARVFAPTLKGLAERASENGPDVNLGAHIAEVVALLEREQLTQVVLVGHSYAGFVISGVCDRVAERIGHAVFLDAFLPESGQKLYDFVKPADRLAAIRAATRDKGKGYQAFQPNAAAWGLTGALLDRVNQRMTPHPAMTLEEPLVLRRGGAYAVPRRTYIDCTQPAMPPFVEIKARVMKDPRWDYLTMTAGHEVMLTHPQEITDILAKLS